ncbi:MAG: cupredoxin domain-containing protein [Anaerolineae bacterium]
MKKKLLALALLGLVLVLTACNTGPKTAEIYVEMLDVQFRPNEFTVPAGAQVTITARNYGLAPHDFNIFKKGFDAGEAFDHADEPNVYWKLQVAPGQMETATFTAPTEPGKYFIACSVHSHLEDGMIATLIVK